MLPGFLRVLWGDLTGEEAKKIGILSAAMMLIIGNYWMLRTTKDPLFNLLVGFRQWQPVAKLFSLVVMIFVVLGYSKLIDLLKRHKLIYFLCSFYGITFLLLSFLISNPSLISVDVTSSFYPYVAWIPGKALGWFAYVFLESYGSLLIALFFSFIASVVTTDLAKKGYGMLTTLIQLGTVSGILFSMFYVKSIGIAKIYFVGGLVTLVAQLVIKYYISRFSGDYERSQDSGTKNKKKTGFFEGLRLIATRPYVVGVFVVATFYEVISTIVEYQMNWIAVGIYPSEAEYTVFRGIQALGINLLALTFAFIGTSFFMRKFGLKFCLMAFPIAIAAVVGVGFFSYSFGVSNYALMWVLLASTVAIKGFNYALNKPSSEVMYIPTSKDVKFKAKGWIDMFGNRSTKGLGSAVTKTFGHSFPALIAYGSFISLGILGFWILIAAFVGNTFNKLQKEDTIIE